ncbi:MAG: hypothetical protein RBQ99_00805 [Trichlorobacter sp.]|nr:hypothetical protein [Trichlorobacter sp.]
MKLKYCIPLLAISVFGSSFVMAADEITIIHRSGKVQTIRIENPDDPVEQVNFRRDTAAAPAAKQQNTQKDESVNAAPAVPVVKGEKTVAVPTEQPAPKNGSGIKIKWAPPVDVLY